MFWFQLLVIAGVLFGVAVVAAGRGAPMGETYPDRAVAELPEGAPVSAADLEAVRFPVVFRGYRMTDVDEVLEWLGAALAARDTRIEELTRARPQPGRERGED